MFSVFIGSVWVTVVATTGIIAGLFGGNVGGFDKMPWPFLLTLLYVPQVAIMITLQVSAKLAQKTSDARAVVDQETTSALQEMIEQQLAIVEAQTQILDLLRHKLNG